MKCRKCRTVVDRNATVYSKSYGGRVCNPPCIDRNNRHAMRAKKDIIREAEEYAILLKYNDLKRKYNDALKLISAQQNIIESPKAKNNITFKTSKTDKEKIVPVLLLSDLHIGANISVDGNRTFDVDMASSRMESVVSSALMLIDEKTSNNSIDYVEVLLAGDLIECLDHGQDQIDLMEQVFSAQNILESAIATISSKYKCNIRVVSGNHDRLSHLKAVPADSPTIKSYAYLIGKRLSSKFNNVIICPDYCHHFKIFNKNAILHHGDGIKGGGGIGGVAPSLVRWHAKYQQVNKFELSFIGHFHSAELVQNHIVVNGCLCGDTPYSRKLGLRSSACQTLCFVGERHGLTSVNRLFF